MHRSPNGKVVQIQRLMRKNRSHVSNGSDLGARPKRGYAAFPTGGSIFELNQSPFSHAVNLYRAPAANVSFPPKVLFAALAAVEKRPLIMNAPRSAKSAQPTLRMARVDDRNAGQTELSPHLRQSPLQLRSSIDQAHSIGECSFSPDGSQRIRLPLSVLPQSPSIRLGVFQTL